MQSNHRYRKRESIISLIVVFAAMALMTGRLFTRPLDDPGSSYRMPSMIQETVSHGYHVPILMYHHVCPVSIGCGLGLRVRPSDFDAQMRYLSEHGYHAITLGELVKNIRGGGKIPNSPIVITFDDGYDDVYQYAFPILRKYGFTATVFLVSSWLDYPGKYKVLSWEQARIMSEYGIEFGSHTLSHPNLLQLPTYKAKEEISESRAALERHLGKPVIVFAYPFGLFNRDIKSFVEQAGYVAAVTTIQGFGDFPCADLLMLKRIRIMGSYSLDDFVRRLNYPVTLIPPPKVTQRPLPGSPGWNKEESRLTSIFNSSSIVRGNPNRKTIALTFDDGPKPGITKLLLDVLDEYGVKATFFLTGTMAERYPELVAEINSRGHVIGDHAYSHQDLTQLSHDAILNELQNTRMLIRGITNKTIRLFRPPGGAINETVVRTAAKAGFITVLWTINVDDVTLSNAQAIAAHILSRAANGDIVLMHDATPATIKALPIIITGLKERGYQFVTVDEMIVENMRSARRGIIKKMIAALKQRLPRLPRVSFR